MAVARSASEVEEALSAGRIDLLVTDDPALRVPAGAAPPPTIFVQPADAPATVGPGPVLRLPASASALTAAMAVALGGAGPGPRRRGPG